MCINYPTENIKSISEFLFIEDDFNSLKHADLVIILCNNNIASIAETFDYLVKNDLISFTGKIVISGNVGSLDKFEEKECIRVKNELVYKYGFSEELFTLEDKSTNIYENLLYSKELISDFNSYQNIIIIGAAFALRRIKLCATKLKYPLNKIQYVGIKDSRGISKDCWWLHEAAKIRVYQELERIGKYLVKGDLDIE